MNRKRKTIVLVNQIGKITPCYLLRMSIDDIKMPNHFFYSAFLHRLQIIFIEFFFTQYANAIVKIDFSTAYSSMITKQMLAYNENTIVKAPGLIENILKNDK